MEAVVKCSWWICTIYTRIY